MYCVIIAIELMEKVEVKELITVTGLAKQSERSRAEFLFKEDKHVCEIISGSYPPMSSTPRKCITH